jgi:hypothetical protein
MIAETSVDIKQGFPLSRIRFNIYIEGNNNEWQEIFGTL